MNKLLELDKWDVRFFKLAYEVKSWSKDPNKQVGAVAVSQDKRHFITGYNGLPACMSDGTLSNMTKEQKNQAIIHAEINLIINAPTKLMGWSLYLTEAPCSVCATALTQTGISKLMCPAIDMTSTWAPLQNVASHILAESRITARYFPRLLIANKLYPTEINNEQSTDCRC